MQIRFTTGGLAVILAALTLAACGDAGDEAKNPRIPAAVAERLAGLSDETAAALEAGDECAAQEAADELEREAVKAQSQIPDELRPEVQEGVQQLTAGISCEPEPVVIETVPEETTTEEDKTSKEDSFCPPGQEKKGDEGDGEDDGKGEGEESGCKQGSSGDEGHGRGKEEKD